MADMNDSGVRLQKVLAAAGVASRRASEELIASGRVEVDGKVVSAMGIRVDPTTAIIKVDGARVVTEESGLLYVALNKPQGVVSAMSDPGDRPTLRDFVAEYPQRLFHVGRLDVETEGLILLTNDGELAHRVAHPRYGVKKTYVAEVVGPVSAGMGQRLRDGVELDDGPAAVDSFRIVERSGSRVMVELTLHEGRNRIVRRMLDAVGHPVKRLSRITVGPVKLGTLRPGATRELTSSEVSQLYTDVEL